MSTHKPIYPPSRRLHRWALVVCLLIPSLGQGANTDPRLDAARSTVELATLQVESLPLTDWVLRMSERLTPRIPDTETRLSLLRNVQWQAERNAISPDLLLALIEVESGYDPNAVSRAGARGLMQVMPFWVGLIGRAGDNLFDIRTNIAYGSAILRHYLDVDDNDLTSALARYNGSQGQEWYPNRIYKVHQRGWANLPRLTAKDAATPEQIAQILSAATSSDDGRCLEGPGFKLCRE